MIETTAATMAKMSASTPNTLMHQWLDRTLGQLLNTEHQRDPRERGSSLGLRAVSTPITLRAVPAVKLAVAERHLFRFLQLGHRLEGLTFRAPDVWSLLPGWSTGARRNRWRRRFHLLGRGCGLRWLGQPESFES